VKSELDLGGCLSLLDGGTQSTYYLSDFDSLANEPIEVFLIQIPDIEGYVKV